MRLGGVFSFKLSKASFIFGVSKKEVKIESNYNNINIFILQNWSLFVKAHDTNTRMKLRTLTNRAHESGKTNDTNREINQKLGLSRVFGFENFVDNPIFLSLFGSHEEVAIDILFDLRNRLASVLGQNLIQAFAGL